MAGVLFLIFGLWMLFDSALGLRSVAIAVTVGVVLTAATMVGAQTRRRRRQQAPRAERLTDVD